MVRSMYWRGRSFDRVPVDKKRSDFQEWNYRSEIFAFSRRLQENLDENTLRQIFTHPMYLKNFQENRIRFNLPEINMDSNESFTHRGRQLLDDCLKQYLRFTYKKLPEEGIANITDYLMSEEVLAHVASWIGCKEIVLSTEYPPSPHTMSNTVLALLAGIEKDLGIDRTRRFIVDMIITYLNDKDILDDIWIIPSPKGALNIILENSKMPAYEARIMFQTGIKTVESCYVIGLYSDKKFLGSSAGETTDIAEECAALDALARMFDLTESREPMIYGEASEKIEYDAHSKEHCRIKEYKISIC